MLCDLEQKLTQDYKNAVNSALKVLGKDNLALIMHGVSFPADSGSDTGFGTYNSNAAKRLMDFASGVFTAIQLGPNGKTKSGDSSPYTGTVFSVNPLFLDLKELTTKQCDNLLSEKTFEKIVSANPASGTARAAYSYALGAYETAFDEIWQNYKKNFFSKYKMPFAKFKKDNALWLDNDALYEAFSLENGSDFWPSWSNELDKNVFKLNNAEAKKRIKNLKERSLNHGSQRNFAWPSGTGSFCVKLYL